MAASLAKRYFFKLLANIVSIPVYLVMEAILPRALGPQIYGNYSFSTALFLQFSGFIDMGSSTCLYNYLSRANSRTSLLSFYLRIILIVAAVILIISTLVLWKPFGSMLLPDIPLWVGPMAGLWALLTWLGRVFRSTNDAIGITVTSEIWRSALAIAGVGILVLLYFTSCLNLYTLFLQQYLLLGATLTAFWLITYSHWKKGGRRFNFSLTANAKKIYTRRFFNYSHPLFVQALLSFLMLAAERWLLQWFDGSAQQGFFALSQKVSMACFLFVSAMTPLLMRELSVAWGHKDVARMSVLITRFAPLLYALAAYFSCFTMVEGAAMVDIFGGAEFAAAVLPVQIMALYPLHQAYGQIATSVFHATGKTRILRNITGLECIYGLAFTWILLAPAQYWGLNLGATGLAIKTVCVQFLSVNFCLWLASRTIPFNFAHNLCHQIWCLFTFVFLAYVCRNISFHISAEFTPPIWRFLVSGFFYTSMVAVTAIISPQLLGLTRREITDFYLRLRHAFKYKKGN